VGVGAATVDARHASFYWGIQEQIDIVQDTLKGGARGARKEVRATGLLTSAWEAVSRMPLYRPRERDYWSAICPLEARWRRYLLRISSPPRSGKLPGSASL
jgi:hypothetical protein